MKYGTKIKWYSHLNKNSPLLANEWGSLINVFDACLVNGFSEQQATNISIVGNTLVLTYTQAHQYQQYQVINITGANTAILNGEHRITYVSPNGLSLSIDFESLAGVTETATILTTKLPSLGWEKVYNATGKAVYKFVKSTGTPNYLFVDDTFPGSPYNTTWAKYARVGLSESYTGDFTPQGATIPTDWSTFPSAVSGANTYFGAYKWFYATNQESTTATNSFNVAAGAGNRQWYLVGDPTYCYLVNGTLVNSVWYSLFGVGEYDCIHQGFKDNVFLAPFIWNGQVSSQAAGYMNSYTNSLISINLNFPILKSYISDSQQMASVNSYSGISATGSLNTLSVAGPVNHFRTFVRANNIILGSLKGLYWIGLLQPYRHLQKIQQSTDIYLNINQYVSSGSLGSYVLKIGSSD